MEKRCLMIRGVEGGVQEREREREDVGRKASAPQTAPTSLLSWPSLSGTAIAIKIEWTGGQNILAAAREHSREDSEVP